MSSGISIASTDLNVIELQLGREPRGVIEISARCVCSDPLVVRTLPRLPDGTPFPTTYYITCPKLSGAIGTLESSGLMREMENLLELDPELATSYASAHEDYLTERNAIEFVPELDGISAGGMPTRVKCLHVLIGHSLAKGPGVNPLGDLALERLDPLWSVNNCAHR